MRGKERRSERGGVLDVLRTSEQRSDAASRLDPSQGVSVYVQWAGFAPNAGAGSLSRNAGQVIGVFGNVEVKQYQTSEEALAGYPSTVEANTLVSLEERLWELASPVWPEDVLPPIDRTKAARGAELYRDHCASCHALLERDAPERKVTAMITSVDVVGTDPVRPAPASGTASHEVRGRSMGVRPRQGRLRQRGGGPMGLRYVADRQPQRGTHLRHHPGRGG
jgi:hypothetical protein